MIDDLDLALAPEQNEVHPKQGRRANRMAFETKAEESNPFETGGSPLKARPPSGELFLDEGFKVSRGGGAANRGRRNMGGWAEERTKTAKSVRIQSAAQQIAASQNAGDSDEDGNFPDIPDLDEVHDEDMTLQVNEFYRY